MPITERLGVQGEARSAKTWAPSSAASARESIPTDPNTIRDAGGWFEVWYDWTPQSPQPRRLLGRRSERSRPGHTSASRSYNQFYFGNLIYDVTKNFLIGMEVSSWKTLYVGRTARRLGPHASSWRSTGFSGEWRGQSGEGSTVCHCLLASSDRPCSQGGIAC